jgi:hypothetical protein
MGDTERLQAIARRVPPSIDGRCWRVGIDGPDGAGKSRFAHDLARSLQVDQSHPVVSDSVDGICLHRDELLDEWDLTVKSEASN